MKIHEQVRELKHYGPDRQRGTTYAVDDALSKLLPKLALPTMGEAARVAFRALLAYEAPTSSTSVSDIFTLVEARGYTAHPCDWIPDFRWGYRIRLEPLRVAVQFNPFRNLHTQFFNTSLCLS